MKRKRAAVEAAFILVAIGVPVLLLVALEERQARELAEQRVRDLANGLNTEWVVDAGSWGARRRPRNRLWCGQIDRADGLVAVLTKSGPLPLYTKVSDVSVNWRGGQSPEQIDLLHRCIARLNQARPL